MKQSKQSLLFLLAMFLWPNLNAQTARLQIIHNAPSPVVDIYVNGALLLNDFTFRTATPFLDVPAGVPLSVAVAPSTSTGVADAIATFPVTFELGGTYVVTAGGVVGNTGATAFNLFINPDAREAATNSSNVDVALFHGSPDAPEVDVTLPGGPVLFDNVSFGEYADYFSAPAASYTIYVTPGNDNNTVVAAYIADLSAIAGQAVTVFATGFLGGQSPAFGVWAALPNGVTFPLATTVSTRNITASEIGLVLQPNPATQQVQIHLNLVRSSDVNYRFLNQDGRVVMTGSLGTVAAGEFNQQIAINQLPAGLYSMQLITGEGFVTAKLVVNK